jgi:tRNA dimethylallyltransferase
VTVNLLNPATAIAIHGCTGVGKTGFSITIAQIFNGEVVNADSRYLYRHLQIGVAKPTREQLETVRHHLVDVLDPTEHAFLPRIQTLAYRAFDDIHTRGLLPVLVGGTPLYMNAITQGWQVPNVAPDPEFRLALENRLADEGVEVLSAELALVDPIAADRSGRNGRRIIRALEIYAATAIPMSTLESRHEPHENFLNIGLLRDREKLHEDLSRRIDQHIEDGLVEEIQGLLESGLTGQEPAFSAIGYRQLLPYLRGEQSLNEAIDQIKHDTNRYVRHQSTWLRKRTDILWFDTADSDWQDRAIRLVASQLAQTSTA